MAQNDPSLPSIPRSSDLRLLRPLSDFFRKEVIGGLEPGDYLYLRARQTDGGAAWSSPFFFD